MGFPDLTSVSFHCLQVEVRLSVGRSQLSLPAVPRERNTTQNRQPSRHAASQESDTPGGKQGLVHRWLHKWREQPSR